MTTEPTPSPDAARLERGYDAPSKFRRTFTEVAPLDPLHDETWTQDYRDHRDRELDKLAAAIRRRTT